MGTSLREFSFVLLALCACFVSGERPVLDLFGGGASVTTIEVLIGTAEEFTVRLVQNDDTEDLVTDEDEDIQYVIAKINGRGQGSEDLVLDTTDISLTVSTAVREAGEIEIRISSDQFNASAANYSTVLENLSYRSNLTSSALSEPPRNVTITAFDAVGPGNTLTALIELLLPNQEAPIFTENATYAASLAENSPDGTEIDLISATDPEGRSVSYSATSSVFAIDEVTGVVMVTDSSALNYEDRRSFELTITASDGDPFTPLTSEATLIITLTNINDNDPVFNPNSYEANVPENVEDAFVVMLSATDADGDTLEYFFLSTDTDSTFDLNSVTGEITVQDQLDYETTTSYTFDVLVFDGMQSDTATVIVSVTDIADGRPVVLPLQKDLIINLDNGTFLSLCLSAVNM